MQEALAKFRAKCEFLEKAYAQLIAAGNIMVLCAGATSDSFRRELRLKGRALTLENIQELADDSRRAEKEEQDMNALRGEQIRAVGKAGARQRNSQNIRNRGQTSGKRPCNRMSPDLLLASKWCATCLWDFF